VNSRWQPLIWRGDATRRDTRWRRFNTYLSVSGVVLSRRQRWSQLSRPWRLCPRQRRTTTRSALPLPPHEREGESPPQAPPTRVCNWPRLGTVRREPIKSPVVFSLTNNNAAHYFSSAVRWKYVEARMKTLFINLYVVIFQGFIFQNILKL